MDVITVLAKLVIGHAFADFPFQSDFMAKAKNRHSPPTPPPGAVLQPIWPIVLTAHAVVHGAFVWWATGLLALGVAEVIAHWLIDFGKCESRYGIWTDQALHLACKVVWCVLATWIIT